jgi:cobaltochelatase CobN
MHLLRSETVTLDEIEGAIDLEQTPGDVLFLSFTDSDLSGIRNAWATNSTVYPSLRVAKLSDLRHPYSVDLYIEKMIAKAKFVFVRLLGGKDYWPYGVEELGRAARLHNVPLAIVPGDYQKDPRLDAASTLPESDLHLLWRYCHEGGHENFIQCLNFIAKRLGHDVEPTAPLENTAITFYDSATRASATSTHRALIVGYRSIMVADDTAPLIALADALAERGFDVDCACVSSLKDPVAADALDHHLRLKRPHIILNTTSFSAKRDDSTTVLDAADCPVLQVALATTQYAPWVASTRGLSATDLAMNIVLPELDGRIISRAISFKTETERLADAEFSHIVHKPLPDRVSFVADLAKAWAQLQTKSPSERRIAAILSDYPHKSGRAGYAVGLDTPESLLVIADELRSRGYVIGTLTTAQDIMAMLTHGPETLDIAYDEYVAAFSNLPQNFRLSVKEAWGEPDRSGYQYRVIFADHMTIALQPARGGRDVKGDYHDPTRPPCHRYIAFYLWLTRTLKPDAMIHCGTHGTLEWLPGKSVALSEDCVPELLLGAIPVVYPFIVNNPGEAAQAKRRIAAVTLGHLTPPLIEAGSHGAATDIEALLDEYSTAQMLDPKRATQLATVITSRAKEAGLFQDAGIDPNSAEDEAVVALDAWLCDLKDMRIGDGLHVFGRGKPTAAAPIDSHDMALHTSASSHHETLDGDRCAAMELEGLCRALDGRFVPPGPAGAPSRGRTDVLPTGRNLFTIDPRAVPTRTSWDIGRRTADAVVTRYAQDNGEWPRSIVIDLWASASMRTGGDDLAQAFALIGAKPRWDHSSTRVSGFDILTPAQFGRPRVDVTLRISGLFRDVFGAQMALFNEAVQAISQLDETDEDNPLAAKSRLSTNAPLRIFGSAPGTYGLGLGETLAKESWTDRAALAEIYLSQNGYAYQGEGSAIEAPSQFRERVADADAFLHVQDIEDQDILNSDAFAEHEGGFAAAASLLGATPALYHIDSTRADKDIKVRTTGEELARVLRGRATNPRWIEGQMRHGYRGATEIAETLSNLYAYAALTDGVKNHHFDAIFDATFGNDRVKEFLERENLDAAKSMAQIFLNAERRGFWVSRRNSTHASLHELLSGSSHDAA